MNERQVIANITLTLDGHTTGPGGQYDMSCIAPHGVSEQARNALKGMTGATVALLGRRNYEGFGGYWPPVADDQSADPRDRDFARWLSEVKKMVFSTTLTGELTWKNAELATASPADVVRELRGSAGGDIRVLSSQSIIKQLLKSDEIDQLEITLAPELVGGGARLFDDDLPASTWALVNTETTDTHAVRLTYRSTTERSTR